MTPTIFHFIPGDPLSPTAQRKDGKVHQLNTTPNSDNANQIFGLALDSGDFYRMGIAAHSYVDTWAHQNFVGCYDAFNAMSGLLSLALPNIGHADAKYKPDWPALVWRDCRLTHETVDNRQRFLEAAKYLFFKFRYLVRPDCRKATDDAASLLEDIDAAIGENDQRNQHRSARIQRYCNLSEDVRYGGQRLPIFNAQSWLDEAVETTQAGNFSKLSWIAKLNPRSSPYTWKKNYKTSHWYQFQEALKVQQKTAWEVLKNSSFKGLRLENL